MSTPLREIFLALGIKTDAAVDGLDRVDDAADKSKKNLKSLEDRAKETASSLRDFGSTIANGAKIAAVAVTGATVAAAVFFERWSKGAQEVQNTAKSYGLTTDALQEFRFAAEKAGGDGEVITEVFKEMGLRIAELAETGTGSAADALTLLGIKVADIRKLKPEDQFNEIADALSNVADSGTRAFIKDSLFGGEGAEKLGDLMERGAEGIGKLRKEAQSLGVVLDKDAIRQANELRESFFTLHKTGEGFVNFLASRMSGRVKEIVDRLVAWATANKDVIATRIEHVIMQLIDLLAKVGPLLGDTVDLFSKLVDNIGGLDKALYGAGAAWAAFQLAGMAAMGPLNAALATFLASFAAGIALAQWAKGDDKSRDAASEGANAKFSKFAARALEESQKEQTWDPAIDEARERLRLKVIESDKFRVFSPNDVSTPQVVERRNKALRELEAASRDLDAAYASDAAHRIETEQNSFKAGKIAKPGATTTVTSASEIAAAEKRANELDRDRRIRTELETMRSTSEGPRRMAIDAALRGVEGRISGGQVKGVNELIAEAVGQGTGLGGGALRPAGLGTSINNIDASVTFNLGGIEVTAEVAGAVSSQAQAAGRSIGESVMGALRPLFNEAFQTQRGQIIG